MLIKDLLEAPGETYEVKTSRLPNGITVDGIDAKTKKPMVYKWDKALETWKPGVKIEGTTKIKWGGVIPRELARDQDGRLLSNPDNGQPFETKYTQLWLKNVNLAIADLDDKTTDNAPATETQPIKHGQKEKMGEQTYVYDQYKNAWFNAVSKREVGKNTEMNAMLFAKNGWNPDGQTELDDTVTAQIGNLLSDIVDIPDWLKDGGELGAASKVKAKTWLGRMSGKVGDGVARALIAAWRKKDSENKGIDPDKDTDTEKFDSGNPSEIKPTENSQQLKLTFKRSKQQNPDIKQGWEGKINGKVYKWKVAGTGANTSNQWIEQKTKQIFTVLPQVHASIIKNITPEDLEKLNKGEQIPINGKPATPTQFLHAQLYALYHQKNK